LTNEAFCLIGKAKYPLGNAQKMQIQEENMRAIITDTTGTIKGYYEDGEIKNAKFETLAFHENEEVKDKFFNVVAYIKDDQILNGEYNLIGTIEKDMIKDSKYETLCYFSNEAIRDVYYNDMGYIEGELKQDAIVLVAIFLFDVIKLLSGSYED
jgi:hypothetical protein